MTRMQYQKWFDAEPPRDVESAWRKAMLTSGMEPVDAAWACDRRVRDWIAEHTTQVAVIDALSSAADDSTRYAAAKNKMASQDILSFMTGDTSRSVRLIIALRKLPPGVAEKWIQAETHPIIVLLLSHRQDVSDGTVARLTAQEEGPQQKRRLMESVRWRRFIFGDSDGTGGWREWFDESPDLEFWHRLAVVMYHHRDDDGIMTGMLSKFSASEITWVSTHSLSPWLIEIAHQAGSGGVK